MLLSLFSPALTWRELFRSLFGEFPSRYLNEYRSVYSLFQQYKEFFESSSTTQHFLSSFRPGITEHQRRDKEKERRIKQEEERKRKQREDAERRLQAALQTQQRLADLDAQRAAAEASWINPVKVEIQSEFVPWLAHQVEQQVGEVNEGTQALHSSIISVTRTVSQQTDESRIVRRQEEFDAYVQARFEGRTIPKISIQTNTEKIEQEETERRQRLNRQRYINTVPIEADPEARAQFLIGQREAAIAARKKYQEDIILVQSQFRARRDRRRVAALKARRDLLERRKTMNEKDLVMTLGVQLGMTIEQLKQAEEHMNQSDSISLEEKTQTDIKILTDAADTNSTANAPQSPTNPSGATLPTTKPNMLSVDLNSQSINAAVPATPSSSTARTPRAAIHPRPTHGLHITKIKKEGAASQASLLVHDIITHINNQPIYRLQQYNDLLKQHHAGDILSLSVYRPYSRRLDIINIECHCNEDEEYPIDRVRSLREEAGLPVHSAPLYTSESAAIEIQKIPIKLGLSVNKNKNGSGVVITKISSGSSAANIGLCDGDIIIKADQNSIESLDEWKEISKGWKAGDLVKLQIQRPPAITGGNNDIGVIKLVLEVGGGGKKTTVESIRALRLIAGLKVAK